MHPVALYELADRTFIKNDDTTLQEKQELINVMKCAIGDVTQIYKRHERRIHSARMKYLAKICAALICDVIKDRKEWDRYTFGSRTLVKLFRGAGMYITAKEGANIARRLHSQNPTIMEHVSRGKYTIRNMKEWVNKYERP